MDQGATSLLTGPIGVFLNLQPPTRTNSLWHPTSVCCEDTCVQNKTTTTTNHGSLQMWSCTRSRWGTYTSGDRALCTRPGTIWDESRQELQWEAKIQLLIQQSCFRLQQTTRSAEKIISAHLPSIQDFYRARWRNEQTPHIPDTKAFTLRQTLQSTTDKNQPHRQFYPPAVTENYTMNICVSAF